MKHQVTQKQSIFKKISGLGLAAFAITVSYAQPAFGDAKSEILGGADSTGQQGGRSLTQQIEVVTNLLLFLVGIIAVIAIIIGGIRYTTSNGDAGQVKAAKDTVLYAVVGLIVAIMAYAIVRWVVGLF